MMASFTGRAPTRRLVLGSGAALAASALLPLRAAVPGSINVHSHHAPPAFVKAIKGTPDDAPQNAAWTVQQTLDDMGKAGIGTSILSVTRPGIGFLYPESSQAVARSCNEFSAQLATDHKGVFGNFATLPMPYVKPTLVEIAYALDVLKLEGVCMMTNYSDKWLGDKSYAPVMEELNRRGAIVYVHPTASACCARSVPDVPPSLFEFNTDTTRAVASLIFTGTADRFPNIKFIFSHGGGTVPMLVDRFTNLPRSDKRYAAMTPEGVMAALQRFYYDTAIATNAPAMAALGAMVPITQIVFGTDFPFRTSPVQAAALKTLLGPADLAAVERDNAVRLMPRFA